MSTATLTRTEPIHDPAHDPDAPATAGDPAHAPAAGPDPRKVAFAALVSRVLADLAVDPVTKIREAGIRGRLDDSNECAAARYLHARLGLDVTVSVFYDETYACHGRLDCTVIAPTPAAVGGFACEFDLGDHPDLVEARS